MLNTGWGQWDKFLYNFVGKKLNIMEIGAYEGEATSWFLRNLMSNKESKIYAIDTFKGSPEYIDTDFSVIKKTFFKNIKETKRDNQVIVMEMMSFTALNKLIYEKKMINQFDIIFIDASHEANDVIMDAVLAWNLLKVNGVLIFDDYKWKKIIQKNYRPALAIDSFIAIFKPEIEVLNIGWQFILRKIEKDESDLPIVTENLFNEVNDLYTNFYKKFYDFNKIELETHNEKINFNLKFDTIETLHKTSNLTSSLDNILFKKYDNINVNFNYILPSFFLNFDKDSDYIKSNNKAKDKIMKFQKNNFNFKKSLLCYSENLISLLKSFNTNDINILNFDFVSENYNKVNEQILKDKKYNFYNIKITNDNNITNLVKNNLQKTNYLHFYNLNDIISLSNLLKNNIDIAILNLDSNEVIQSKSITCLIFYYCYFILMIQSKKGSSSITIPIFNNRLVFDVIYIFCKYYNKIEIKNNFCNTTMTNNFVLMLYDFKGINENELNELLNICKLINFKIKDGGIHLNIFDDNLRKELNFNKLITKESSNITISNIHNNKIKNLDEINNFIRSKYSIFNSEIKLVKRVSKILEEVQNSEFDKKINQLDNLIYNKQIEFLTLFYDKVIS